MQNRNSLLRDFSRWGAPRSSRVQNVKSSSAQRSPRFRRLVISQRLISHWGALQDFHPRLEGEISSVIAQPCRSLVILTATYFAFGGTPGFPRVSNPEALLLCSSEWLESRLERLLQDRRLAKAFHMLAHSWDCHLRIVCYGCTKP